MVWPCMTRVSTKRVHESLAAPFSPIWLYHHVAVRIAQSDFWHFAFEIEGQILIDIILII